MPAQTQPPHDQFRQQLAGLEARLQAVERQQQMVITDPTGASGDPAHGNALMVTGSLKAICGISAFGCAMWSGSAWVQIPTGLVPGGTALLVANNLSDVASRAASVDNLQALDQNENLAELASAAAARTNLGLGTAAVVALSSLLQAANNLSDLASAAAARTNLGLGTAAVVALSSLLQAANNLSDLANKSTAIDNLGALDAAENLADLASVTTARTNLGLGQPARAYRNAALNLANGITAIPLDTVSFDTGGAGDTAHFFGGSSAQLVTNGGKYIAPSAGDYLIAATVRATAAAAGQLLYPFIYVNTVLTDAGSEQWSQAANIFGSSYINILALSAGDVVELRIQSTAAIALTVGSSLENNLTITQLSLH